MKKSSPSYTGLIVATVLSVYLLGFFIIWLDDVFLQSRMYSSLPSPARLAIRAAYSPLVFVISRLAPSP